MHCNVTNLSTAHKYITLCISSFPNIAIAVKIPTLKSIEHNSKFRFFSVSRFILRNVATELGVSPKVLFRTLIGLMNNSKSRVESTLSETAQAMTIYRRFAD